MLVVQAYVAECITSKYTCTNLWNSETCVQRNGKGPNFFRCRRVPFYTGNLNMNHRDSKSSTCKTVLLQTSFGYTQVPLNTGFTVLWSVPTGVNTQRRNGKSRSCPHFCNSARRGAETFGAESIWVTVVIRHPIKQAKMVGPTTPNFQGVPLQHDATSG